MKGRIVNTFTKVLLVILVIASFFGGIAFAERDSKIMIMTQYFANSQDGFSAHVVETPFHRWSGYVYMYPIIKEKGEDGYWNDVNVSDGQLDSGNTFIGTIEHEEDYSLSYVVICSPEPIETIEEAEEIFWSSKTNLDQDYWFHPEDGMVRFTLTCDN